MNDIGVLNRLTIYSTNQGSPLMLKASTDAILSLSPRTSSHPFGFFHIHKEDQIVQLLN